MNHTNAFYLEVIRRPEGKDEEKADEEERPGRVVFLFLSHWFVRWGWSGPDVDVRRGELRSVHSFSTSSMAASVRRLRKVSMTRRRKQADRAGARRLWASVPSTFPARRIRRGVRSSEFTTLTFSYSTCFTDFHSILNCTHDTTRPDDKRSQIANCGPVPPLRCRTALAITQEDVPVRYG